MKYAAILARGLGLLTFLSLGALASCSGAQHGASGGCSYGAWQGQCRLVTVRTARTIERFPTSFVVLEATYEPVGGAGVISPPPFRRELTAPAASEGELTAHLKSHELIECSIAPPVSDSCEPPMVAKIPEFLGGAAGGPTGPVGCAKIEQSGNAPIPGDLVLPGPFQFEAETAMSTPEVEQIADEAAKKIAADPKIECVAIKGKSAPGEPFTLANERAQLVKKLIEARGIDKTRVTVFEATAPTYTAQPDDQPVLAEHRRVYLNVVVYGSPSAP